MLLFSTDIDGTVFDGPESASQFAEFWKNLSGFPDPPRLAYNTGRSVDDTLALLKDIDLPSPDYLICGVGTEIYNFKENEVVSDWSDLLAGAWDFEIIQSIVCSNSPARLQPSECQNPFKNSWFWDNADAADIRDLSNTINREGFRVQIVYSSNRDLDVVPESANKGNAVSWLASHLEIPNEQVIVAGDSGNDAAMYHIPGIRGVVVSNAEPSLLEAVRDLPVHFSSRPCAAGVIEGIFALMQPSGETNS